VKVEVGPYALGDRHGKNDRPDATQAGASTPVVRSLHCGLHALAWPKLRRYRARWDVGNRTSVLKRLSM
jgi:hypothetical protein